MDFDEFVRKTEQIRNMSKRTTDEEIKKRLKIEYFDVVIDFFNENLTGDFVHADGSATFVGAIEPGPRTENTHYNETPTTIGPIMSQQASITPKTPSKFAQKLNSMKPSAMDDEKKATVVGRIKIIGAFTAGVLTTVAVAAVTSYQISLKKLDEVEETEETTED